MAVDDLNGPMFSERTISNVPEGCRVTYCVVTTRARGPERSYIVLPKL